jgi:hypothetical protein
MRMEGLITMMEITYRTKKAALAEGKAFMAYAKSNFLPIVRRNLDDRAFDRRNGTTFTLEIDDSLTLQAQDFFGTDGTRIWRNR